MTAALEPGRGHDGKYVRTVESAARDARAAGLIAKGWSYSQVAEHLDYPDRGSCHRAVKRARWEAAQLDPTSQEFASAQLAEMDALKKAAWAVIESPPPLVDRVGRVVHDSDGNIIPNDEAIAKARQDIIKANTRQGQIRGTDAPRKSLSLVATPDAKGLIDVFNAASEPDRMAFVSYVLDFYHQKYPDRITAGTVEP
jgi:hypothetical protein